MKTPQIPENTQGLEISGNFLKLPDFKFGELSQRFPKMVSVYNSEFISLIPTSELSKQVNGFINTAFQELGHNIDPGTSATLCYQVCRELMNLGIMRIGEIQHAIRTGVRGGYPETENKVSINLIRILKWITEYRLSSERKDFIVEYNRIAEDKKEPTTEEKYYTAAQNAYNAFKSYKNGDDIHIIGGVVYDFLTGCGLISLSKEFKKEIWVKAEEIVKADLITQKQFPSGKRNINAINSYLEHIEKQSYVKTDNETERLIASRSKRLALYHYFDGLIALDEPLQIPLMK